MMFHGPGNYDAMCKELLDKTQASGALLWVVGGTLGSGLSIKMPIEDLVILPEALDSLAHLIRIKKTFSDVGKYDAHCSELREQVKARGVFIAVRNGYLGSDLSIQMVPEELAKMPAILETVARQMRADLAAAVPPDTTRTMQ